MSANTGKTAAKRGAKQGKKGLTVAITGAANFLGKKAVQRLIADERVERVVAIDIFPVDVEDPKLSFYKVDLTLPNAGSLITKIFTKERVDALMHLVFIFSLARQGSLAHELEAIGTMHVLDASAEAGVKKIVLRSSTMVYGARPQNPFFLPEEAPLMPPAESFVADKVEAERQLKQFAERHMDVNCVVLREGVALGPNASNFFCNLLKSKVVPMVMGFDPLMQFIHEDDLIEYYMAALFKDVEGTYNVVAPGVLRYSKVLDICNRQKICIPQSLLKPGLGMLWALKAYDVPPDLVAYLMYPLIADGSRAEYVLGIKAKYSSEDAVREFAKTL